MDIVSKRVKAESQRSFDLPSFFGVCDRALAEEVRANTEVLTNSGLSRGLKVFEGAPLEQWESAARRIEYVYAFRYQSPMEHDQVPIELSSGSPCSFSRGGVSATGRIRHHDPHERRLAVALSAPVGEGRGISGTLAFDLSYLLKSLREHLAEIAHACNADERLATETLAFVRGQWGAATPQQLPPALEALNLNAQQRLAVCRVMGGTSHLVWGPPGTGKTTTLGAAVLARKLSNPNERLVILAQTNVALDNAIKSIWRGYRKINPEASVEEFVEEIGLHRVGRAEDDTITDIADALHDELLESDEQTTTIIEELEDEFQSATDGSMKRRAGRVLHAARIHEEEGRASSESLELAKQLEARLVELDEECLSQCDILCTTLSAYDLRREHIKKLPWSAAFIDEVSMIGVARAVAVRSLNVPVFGFGDFQQLPPIVRSRDQEARRALGENLFGWLGATETEEEDERRTMLDTQYRMRPQICMSLSRTFYGGRLQTHRSAQERETRFQTPVFAAYTDELRPQVEEAGKSKRNPIHAELVAMIVAELYAQGTTSIGVVTPYRAQAELVKSFLEPRVLANVDVSTVHRYQGREKDVIIFDSMMAAGAPMDFLTERVNRSIGNMVNVALSRARDALWVVLDESAARDIWAREDIYFKLISAVAATLPSHDPSAEFQFEPEELRQELVRDFIARHVIAQQEGE